MRPLEILLVCLTFLVFAAWLVGIRFTTMGQRICALLLLGLTIIHIMQEGMHWQLAPLYAAILLYLFAELALRSIDQSHLRWGAVAGLVLIVCTAILSYFLPMFHLPSPTGKFAVGTRVLYLVDPTRDAMGGRSLNGHRELMIQLWYPAKSNGERLAVYRRRPEVTLMSSYQSLLRTNSYLSAKIDTLESSYPVLLFNPAWTGQRTQSTFLMQEMASHGFVVASIDHTYYSGLVAFPDGRVIDSSHAPSLGSFMHTTADEELALGAKFTRIEAEDDIFVLDQMQAMNQQPGGDWYGHFDMSRIGVFGHSIGGSVAAEAAYLDPRIKAALNMDGWMFGDAMIHGVAKPFMLIFEKGMEKKPSPEAMAMEPEYVQRYWQLDKKILTNTHVGLAQYGGYEMYINGTSHWNFSDRPLYSPLRKWTDAGSIDPKRAHEIINKYVVAFFSQTLYGTQEPLLGGNSEEFPEVELKSWRGMKQQAIFSMQNKAAIQ